MGICCLISSTLLEEEYNTMMHGRTAAEWGPHYDKKVTKKRRAGFTAIRMTHQKDMEKNHAGYQDQPVKTL